MKRAQRTVRLIEEDLIARGWPVGLYYGSEREIAERHNLGVFAVREAIRILQWRGCVRMQRGPRGGIVVAAPSASSLVRAMGDLLLRLDVTASQASEALVVLKRISSETAGLSSDNAIIGLWIQCGQSLLERLEPGPRKLGDRTADHARCGDPTSQAAVLAQALTDEIRGAKCCAGKRLGSEVDLCERYAVSRVVMRQAIRILEEGGWVQTQRGRGRGIETGEPAPETLVPLLQSYLVAHRIGAQASALAYRALDGELLERALEGNPILVFFLNSLPTGAKRSGQFGRAARLYWGRDRGSLELGS